MLSPGTYLKKRRLAAGLTVDEVAMRIVGLPFVVRATSAIDIVHLALRIERIEADEDHFSQAQIEILRNAYGFDARIYEQLVALTNAPGPVRGSVPQLCRICACSWQDACVSDHGACAWAEPDLCTACVRVAVAERQQAPAEDWPDAPLPEPEPPEPDLPEPLFAREARHG